MSGWLIIPALLGFAVTLAIWTALRLIFWSRAPQNTAGAIMLAAMACTLLGYLYQLVMEDVQVMLAWEKFSVFGLNLVYPAWLVFVLFFTGNGKKVTWLLVTLLGLLSAFPIVVFNLPQTAAWFVQTRGVVAVGPLHILDQQIGWAVLVSTVVAQVEGIISTLYLVNQLRRVRPAYRRHMLVLFLSQFFAFIAIWMEVTGNNPFHPISVFYLSFIPTCIAVSWAIYALRVGQTLPLMREKVVETMHDSVIILDSQNCAAYLNPAALQMFGLPPVQPEKLPLAQLAPQWAAQPSGKFGPGEPDETVTLGDMIYTMKRSVMEDWKGDPIGQVLVLRNVTDREHMEQSLQKRAAELARLNGFTQSLSMLAGRVAASADIEQVYATLKDELHRLNLEYCVGLRTPGKSGYSIEYLSLNHPILQLLEKTVGVKAKSLRVPELGSIHDLGAIDESGTIFVPKVMDTVRMIFDQIPENFEQIILNTTGVSLDVSSYSFRLFAQAEEIGMLAIWGPTLRREDLAPLTTFAFQVSAAIQKAHLVQREQNRITELEHTNRFVLSLTQVATHFEAQLSMDQILEVLGAELRKLDAACVVALLDPETDILIGRYISVHPNAWQAVEKMTGFTLKDFRIPYSTWEKLDPDPAGPASAIDDPLTYVYTTLKNVPRILIQNGLQILGITPQTPAVWMPLRSGGQNLGILVIWGIPQPRQYLTVFSLFARQVATAIEKARLMTDLETLKSFNEGIVQGVAEAIIMLTPQGQITFANLAAGELLGVHSQELVGKEWIAFIPPADRNVVEEWLSGPHFKPAVGLEFNLIHLDGHPIPVLVNIQTIFKEGRPASILISLMDIQQRIQAEQQILSSIEEKEALLKEIHHRVKNNLQIVSSLLNLQASGLKDPHTIEAFRESQNRVRSMALIHEKLYRSNNLARIRFDEYIKDLSLYLIRTYNNSRRQIRLEINAAPLNLDIDTAIPCGLIINELVTNSYKHGFPAGQNLPESESGRICVSLALLPDHQINLSITDNGIGFPEDQGFLQAGSLGLQLVTSLTHQLGGTVTFKTNHGAQTEIIFTSASAYLSHLSDLADGQNWEK